MAEKSKYCKRLKIGDVRLESNIVLAPMAGFSEVGFRSLCRFYGAGLTTTEMISAKALLFHNEKTLKMLETAKNEKPVAVQLFGHEPEDFKNVIESGLLDKFDIIDINMGCPAPKIVNNGDGCALMKDINLAERIIKSAVSVTNKPITVKFRTGFDEKHKNYVEFAKMCERAGASAITIHGRTREQYYSGKSSLEVIKEVASAVKIPVFANGDVTSVEDFEMIIKETGAAGVMIGRGSLGNSSIFAKVSGKNAVFSKYEQIKYIYDVLKEKQYNDNFIIGQMRAHLVHFIKGMHLATELKQKLLMIDGLDDLMKNLKETLD
ncbi:MAG: tRNA dihydrouridine synthase DusB [bacterium]|nr:tRNA dihydrouridine synthase DusB [bacterium]